MQIQTEVLIVESVIQIKSGVMINVDVTVKIQRKIMRAKNIF